VAARQAADGGIEAGRLADQGLIREVGDSEAVGGVRRADALARAPGERGDREGRR